MKRVVFAFLLLVGVAASAEDFTVTRLAGQSGGKGYTDGSGTGARFTSPVDVATDSNGNVYVVDKQASVIRRITPDGVVSTFAGRAGELFHVNGQGGAARFRGCGGIAVDLSGNVWVADGGQASVRRISPGGVVSTFVSGISGTRDVATDSAGNVYTSNGDGIRRYAPSGALISFHGSAEFTDAMYLAVDANDDLFFTTPDHVRKMTAAGVVSTIAPGIHLRGIAVADNGDLYVAEMGAARVVRITPNGTVTPFAGQFFQRGNDDGTGEAARFRLPAGVAIAPGGLLYVSDEEASTIRRITIPDAVVTTFAGAGLPLSATVDGPADAARFDDPRDAAVDSAGNVIVTTDGALRKIAPGGVVSTVASSLVSWSVDVDGDDNAWVATPATIAKVTPDGTVTIVAGHPFASGSTDGTGSDARFNAPRGIVVHPDGDLYVADSGNHTIRKVTTAGVVTTFAGSAGQTGSTDDTGSSARFDFPSGITVDDAGNLYVADRDNFSIRKITVPGAQVTTFSGTPNQTGASDGDFATARFVGPIDLTFDGGNLYVLDSQRVLRKVNAAAEVTTLAGDHFNIGTIDGTGNFVRLFRAEGIGSDGAGNLHIADAQSANIRHARQPGIADLATISPPAPALNALAQLDTTTMTATSWEWTIFRRPTGSVAELSSTAIRNPTFTPDVADLYVILLRAEGPGGVRYSTLEVTPAGCEPIASVVASVPSANVCLNGTGATAGVAVSGGGTLAYQWGWRSVSGGAITPIGGATSASYVLNGADFGSAGTKYLVVTVTPNCGAPLVSNQLPITVTPSPLPVEISASSGVFANGPHNYASVNDAGADVTYVWSITNGTIDAGQGTRNIEYTAGPGGDVTLGVEAGLNGCSTSDEAIVPIVERAAGAAMLYTTPPCRIVDTRIGGPQLASGETRTVQLAGGCGIPSSAVAVAVNITVVSPGGTGWLTAFRAGDALPGSSTLNYREFRTRANNAIVPLSTGGAIDLYTVNHTAGATHFIIDVVGWFE